MIKAKPRQRKGGRGGSRSAFAGAPAPAAGAGGARQRYAGNAPANKVNAKINQAAQKPLGGDAVKVIISNLPNDVTEAAVRVCHVMSCSSLRGQTGNGSILIYRI